MPYFIECSILIDRSQHTTWKALIEERKTIKSVSYNFNFDGSEYDLGQEYPTPFGTAKCTYHVKEFYPNRMEFTLIKSNCFGKLRGHWTLVPVYHEDKSSGTKLTLAIEEVTLKVPIPGPVVKHFSVKQIRSRLKHIRDLADQIAPAQVAPVKELIHLRSLLPLESVQL